MYLYDFKDEQVILESVNNLVSIKDKEMNLNILVTKKYILLFQNLKDKTVLAGRGIHEMPEYELILKILLDEINYEVENNNTIINYEKNEIILYNFNLKKVQN